MDNNLLHEIVITAIIVKDGKYLITKRSATKKRFPNMWTVPGGKLETKNYDLIDGIFDELVMADNKLKGVKSEWKRNI